MRENKNGEYVPVPDVEQSNLLARVEQLLFDRFEVHLAMGEYGDVYEIIGMMKELSLV